MKSKAGKFPSDLSLAIAKAIHNGLLIMPVRTEVGGLEVTADVDYEPTRDGNGAHFIVEIYAGTQTYRRKVIVTTPSSLHGP